MTAGEIASWAQTLILVISLVATTWISIINFKKADSAERRVQAVGDSLADSLERIAQALGQRTGVRWAVHWVYGDTFEIENLGDEAAYQVAMTSHETLFVQCGTDFPISTVNPGDSFSFVAVRTMTTSDANLKVSWESENGETSTWTRLLPLRPKQVK
jgi:uncharacterized protein with PIN domain